MIHCPDSADDEKLCIEPDCPRGCDCLALSYICHNETLEDFQISQFSVAAKTLIFNNNALTMNILAMKLVLMKSIVFLSLQLCNISDIPMGAVRNNKNLKLLDLANNSVSKMVPEALCSITHLLIFLSTNIISELKQAGKPINKSLSVSLWVA